MTTNAIIPAPRPVGRPKKKLDHQKVQRLPEVLPKNPIEALEALLIFDARMLERETQQELIRILPQLVHVRRAWKAHYLEHGCISCPKADEKAAIAARMRLKGYTWDEIFEIVPPNTHNTRLERNASEIPCTGSWSTPKNVPSGM